MRILYHCRHIWPNGHLHRKWLLTSQVQILYEAVRVLLCTHTFKNNKICLFFPPDKIVGKQIDL